MVDENIRKSGSGSQGQSHTCPSNSRLSTIRSENSPIRFIENWGGKLDKEYFTTIRKYDPEKDIYYKNKVGATFDVLLNGEKYCEAKLISCEGMNRLKDLPYGFLVCDTGDTVPLAIFKRFGIGMDDRVIVLCFRRWRS